jgi:hypothetical protein
MTNAKWNAAKAGLAVILKPLVFSRSISSRLWEFDCWEHLACSNSNYNHYNAFEPRDYKPHQQLRHYAYSWAKSIILHKRDIQVCIAPLSSSSPRECSESMILVSWQPLFHSTIYGEYGAWSMFLNLLSSLICIDLVEMWGFALFMSKSTMYYQMIYVVVTLLNQCFWRTRALWTSISSWGVFVRSIWTHKHIRVSMLDFLNRQEGTNHRNHVEKLIDSKEISLSWEQWLWVDNHVIYKSFPYTSEDRDQLFRLSFFHRRDEIAKTTDNSVGDRRRLMIKLVVWSCHRTAALGRLHLHSPRERQCVNGLFNFTSVILFQIIQQFTKPFRSVWISDASSEL